RAAISETQPKPAIAFARSAGEPAQAPALRLARGEGDLRLAEAAAADCGRAGTANSVAGCARLVPGVAVQKFAIPLRAPGAHFRIKATRAESSVPFIPKSASKSAQSNCEL